MFKVCFKAQMLSDCGEGRKVFCIVRTGRDNLSAALFESLGLSVLGFLCLKSFVSESR